MAFGTCHRCKGNAFLEEIDASEAAWVCLQCGSCRYVRKDELWPLTLESPGVTRVQGALR